MDNSTLLKIQSRFLLLAFFVLISNCLIVFFSWSRRSQFDRRYKVDERKFYESVQIGASNYLNSVFSRVSSSENSSSPDPVLEPPQLAFADLVTWLDYSGRYHCRIDGDEYFVGDYTELGLIVKILDRKLLLRGRDGFVVLRRRSSAAEGDARAPRGRPPAAEDGEEG